jgi:flagellar motor switch protein FliM
VNENLSQEEIDTLLHGVDSGEINTESNRMPTYGEVVPYDLGSQDLTPGKHLPALDMVNERFTRSFEKSISSMLRRTAEVSAVGVQMMRFSDFQNNLQLPTSLNLININPLHGVGLFVIESELVFSTVDNFFGGNGRYQANIEEREFTPTENRVIQLFLDMSFFEFTNAWEPVLDLDFVFVKSEIDPQFANIVNHDEAVVVSTFRMELEGSSGDFHVVLPNSMLEPIRDLPGAGINAELDGNDEIWLRSLKDEMNQAIVEIDCAMAHTKLTLSDVLKLNPGDVIPVDLPELVTVRAARTPIFRGVLGVSNGMNSVQFVTPITRPDYSHD